MAAIAESQRWHARYDSGSPNETANAARGLRFLRTGRWGSKPDALRWMTSCGYPAEDAVTLLANELPQQDAR